MILRPTEFTEDAFLEAAPNGSVWNVRLIEQGWSKNGTYYGSAAVDKVAQLAEGASAGWYSWTADKASHYPGKVGSLAGLAGNVCGYFKDARSEGPEGRRVARAQFCCTDPKLQRMLLEAWNRGNRTLLGFSIHAGGSSRDGLAEGRRGRIAASVDELGEVTVVRRPAANGAFEELVAAEDENADPGAVEAAALDSAFLVCNFYRPASSASDDRELAIKKTIAELEGLEHQRPEVARTIAALKAGDLANAQEFILQAMAAHDEEAGVVKESLWKRWTRISGLAETAARIEAAERGAKRYPAIVIRQGYDKAGGFQSREHLESAVRLGHFEGAPVMVAGPRDNVSAWTHAAPFTDVPGEQVGRLEGARWDPREGAVRATVVSTCQWFTEAVDRRIREGKPLGLSVEAHVHVHPGGGRCYVGKLGDGREFPGVRVVACEDPAAGGWFLESLVLEASAPDLDREAQRLRRCKEAAVRYERQAEQLLREGTPKWAARIDARVLRRKAEDMRVAASVSACRHEALEKLNRMESALRERSIAYTPAYAARRRELLEAVERLDRSLTHTEKETCA